MPDSGNDRGQFIAAAALATTAAAMLFEYPIARNIALMIGTIVANPRSMQLAAQQWQQPQGEGGMDFEALSRQMSDLKKECNEKEWWKGPACETFNQSIDTFIQQLDTARRYNENVGQGVDNVATGYHWAAEVVGYVAATMMAVAYYNRASFFAPMGVNMVMKGQVLGILVSLAAVVRGLLGKQMKTVAVITGILATVNLMCGSLSGYMEQTRPRPDFSPAALEYTPGQGTPVGSLQPKNGGIPNLSMGSTGII